MKIRKIYEKDGTGQWHWKYCYQGQNSKKAYLGANNKAVRCFVYPFRHRFIKRLIKFGLQLK